MRIDSGGVEIEFEVTGQGRPALLLHGFPDSGRLWRHQAPVLAEAGYKVIVPDLRGFGSSGRPTDVGAYALWTAGGDILAVLDHLGVERAHVVGHDFGAALAWYLGILNPERVDHLVALSVGHPSSFRSAGLEQLEKSWYMLLYQFEGVAERWLSDDSWANFRAWSNHPDADAVIADLERDGALTSALNWYRANVPPEALLGPPMELPLVEAPTLGVWSTGDFALTERQMSGSSAHVAGPWHYERMEGPGHWFPLEAPDEVSRLLLDFLPR